MEAKLAILLTLKTEGTITLPNYSSDKQLYDELAGEYLIRLNPVINGYLVELTPLGEVILDLQIE